ncbi:MAG TPA: NAD(P)-dependent oxidoreductase [Alphaproteobacteria bacterium]
MTTPRPAGPLVVILDEGYDGTEIESTVLAPFGAVVVERPCHGRAAAVRQAVAGANAVLVRESPVDAEAIAAMPECRVIVRYGVGVDNIDREAAAARRLYVANVPDYGVEEVSDHALALLLAVRIFGAGLDVYEREPPATDGPLFGLSNVVVTDHTGWSSEEAVADLRRKASEEVARVLSGRPPRNWANPWKG